MGSILPTILLAFCAWALWRLVSFIRTRIVTAHLQRIRGPQATSLWTGELTNILPFMNKWVTGAGHR